MSTIAPWGVPQGPSLFSAPVLQWTRMDWSNKAMTFPPDGEQVLMCDLAGNMAVCRFNRGADDALLVLDHLMSLNGAAFDENGEEIDLSEYEQYFLDPVAWMPAPAPPLAILDGDAQHDVTMRAYGVADRLMPHLIHALSEETKAVER